MAATGSVMNRVAKAVGAERAATARVNKVAECILKKKVGDKRVGG